MNYVDCLKNISQIFVIISLSCGIFIYRIIQNLKSISK